MTLRGERLGVMTLSTTDSGRRLGPDELAVLEELGRRAAVAVDNARLHRQRSAIARTLQNSLLPPALPEIAGIETAALYRAAGEGTDVGGDFYDLFSVGEDEWIAVIGDVCGKGAEAAAVTALARYTIRTAAVRRRSPAAILLWLNDAMQRQDLDGRFCTIACVHLDTSRPVDPRAGRLRRAIRRRSCGARTGAVEEVGVAGTLLGLVPDPVLSDERRELGAGDALVLYTDGITEARAPERILSGDELLAALRDIPAGSAQRIVEQLAALAMGKEGTPPRDDIAILALRAARLVLRVARRLAVVVVRRVGVRARPLTDGGLAAVRGVVGHDAPAGPPRGSRASDWSSPPSRSGPALEVGDLVGLLVGALLVAGQLRPSPRPCSPPGGPGGGCRRRR